VKATADQQLGSIRSSPHHAMLANHQPAMTPAHSVRITAIRDLAKMINQWLQLGPFRGE
jgi:hypothetical protein